MFAQLQTCWYFNILSNKSQQKTTKKALFLVILSNYPNGSKEKNRKLKIKTQNDKSKFKNDTLCHCEPEQSEGAAISNLSDEIASVVSPPHNEILHFAM